MPRLRAAPKPSEMMETEKKEDQVQQSAAEQQQTEPQVEPVVEPAVEPDEQEPKTDLLLKQIEDLKAAEKAQRDRADRYAKERQQARQEALDRAAEIEQFRKTAVQAETNATTSALESAKAEAEAAKREIKTAISNGDIDAQADAMERLAEAKAKINHLSATKTAIENRVNNQQSSRTGNDFESIIARMNPPQWVEDWLRDHQDYLLDPSKNAVLNHLHKIAVDSGLVGGTEPYKDFIETRLGMRAPEVRQPRQQEQQEQQDQQQPRGSIVSAPVSRELPSGPGSSRRSGDIKLNPEQREIARLAGITDAEYALQLKKMREAQANGQYSGDGR